MSDHTEEIRARVEAARPQESWATERASLVVTHAEPNVLTRIWYDDGDLCAEVHDNLALGCDADAMAQLFANAVDDIPHLLTALQKVEADRNRYIQRAGNAEGRLEIAEADLQALREENARLKGVLEEIRDHSLTFDLDEIHYIAAAALSSSPAQEQKP